MPTTAHSSGDVHATDAVTTAGPRPASGSLWRSWTIARVKGIPIRLHPTFLIALPFFAYVMAMDHFATVAGGLNPAALAWGGLLALALFASVTLHELAHSVVALRFGVAVRDITLLPIGGVSALAVPPKDGRAEFWITFVGPLTNFALAAPLLAASWLGLVPASPVGLAMFVSWMGWMNLTLGAFNLFLPAFPMDGGRIVRALLARRMGHTRATRVAVALGGASAIAMGIIGLATSNLILVLIGVFVYFGAKAEGTATSLAAALEGVRARDLATVVAPLSMEATRAEALARMRAELQPFLAVTLDARPIAIVSLERLAAAPADARSPTAAVAYASAPRTVPASAPAQEILALAHEPTPAVVVDEAGRYIGLFDAAALARASVFAHARDHREPQEPSSP